MGAEDGEGTETRRVRAYREPMIVGSRLVETGGDLHAVSVTEGGVRIDDKLVARPGDVAFGWVRQRNGGEHELVLLDRRARTLARIGVASQEEGRRWLGLVGVHQGGAGAELFCWARSQLEGLWKGGLLPFLTFALGLSALPLAPQYPVAWSAVLLLPPLVTSLPLLWGRGRLRLSVDGVVITGPKRFIPYGAISQVREDGMRLSLTLRTGETVVVQGSAYRHDEETANPVPAIAAHIREAASVARDGGSAAARRLSRGRSDARAWLERIRRLARGYREAALPTADLWSILEGPGAEPSARVGAARLLAEQLDGGGQERLARVGRATGFPRVRVAIECAQEGDLERLEQSMLDTDTDGPVGVREGRRAKSRADGL